MFKLMSTLVRGANATAVEKATDYYAMDLLRQKIRESEEALSAAKNTLGSLIIRQRQENKLRDQVNTRIKNLEKRATLALKDDNEALAAEAASTIAQLQDELAVREDALLKLDQRCMRIRGSIEKANRRIIDLRQGMVTAKACDDERRAQKRLNRTIGNTAAMEEAEALIERITGQSDPFEENEILSEIDDSLNGKNVEQKLADAGYGAPTKTKADDVLARLKKASGKS